MSPGQRFEELWRRLMRAQSPFNLMLATQNIKRRAALAVIAETRAVLDEMEQLLNGVKK